MIAAFVYCIGALIYVILGSGKEQEWNKVDEENSYLIVDDSKSD